MKVYIVMRGSCEYGGYNHEEGILSVHLSEESAKAAAEEYESWQDDTELDWAFVKEYKVEE